MSRPGQGLVLLVMGVSGAGKSTLARDLAEALRCSFREGDDLHPRRNRDKLARGAPLDDADRRPWLAAVRNWIDARLAAGEIGVVSCSALKRRHRHQLGAERPQVLLVFLHGSHRLLAGRLRRRRGHFASPKLLDSQLAALQPPVASERPLTVEIGTGDPSRVLAKVLGKLRCRLDASELFRRMT